MKKVVLFLSGIFLIVSLSILNLDEVLSTSETNLSLSQVMKIAQAQEEDGREVYEPKYTWCLILDFDCFNIPGIGWMCGFQGSIGDKLECETPGYRTCYPEPCKPRVN